MTCSESTTETTQHETLGEFRSSLIWPAPVLACGRRSGRATSLQLGARLYLVAAAPSASQRSLHNEPIFRLLLKVAVNGVSQCEFEIFSRTLWVHQQLSSSIIFCVLHRLIEPVVMQIVIDLSLWLCNVVVRGDELRDAARQEHGRKKFLCWRSHDIDHADHVARHIFTTLSCETLCDSRVTNVLAEGAIAWSMTPCGGALIC